MVSYHPIPLMIRVIQRFRTFVLLVLSHVEGAIVRSEGGDNLMEKKMMSTIFKIMRSSLPYSVYMVIPNMVK